MRNRSIVRLIAVGESEPPEHVDTQSKAPVSPSDQADQWPDRLEYVSDLLLGLHGMLHANDVAEYRDGEALMAALEVAMHLADRMARNAGAPDRAS